MAREIFLIYARAANGVIGRDNALPWHISSDLKRFKTLTMGKAMVMGRKTFESFPRTLPGRRHIVLTRNAEWQASGAEPAGSVEQALAVAGESDIAVIGGAEVNALFLPLANRVEHTEVHADYDGDTVMPPLGPEWRESFREEHAATDSAPAFAFVTLLREFRPHP